ncbi:MAG: hypothetical protein Q8O03_03805 [Nanoarchaeota archaeon]|nr:hypothetical protein [Nanoarchaeota archaeon]
MKFKKKIIPIICALGLMAAYPATGLDNPTKDRYKDVKKLKITNSYFKWFNDTGIIDQAKYSEVERTFKNGDVLTETDCGIDGTIDYIVMKHVKVSDKHGYKTVVVEEDLGNDGKIETITTYKHMLGGSRTEVDLGADGKVDYTIAEMLVSKGKITEYLDGNGVATHRETQKFLEDGSILTEHDVFADGKIDYISVEKVLSDGIKVTQYTSYDKDGDEKYDFLSEKTLPDGTKVSEFDIGYDGTIDQRQREKVTSNLPGSTTRVYELEAKGDGVVTYQNIDEILEFDLL